MMYFFGFYLFYCFTVIETLQTKPLNFLTVACGSCLNILRQCNACSFKREIELLGCLHHTFACSAFSAYALFNLFWFICVRFVSLLSNRPLSLLSTRQSASSHGVPLDVTVEPRMH